MNMTKHYILIGLIVTLAVIFISGCIQHPRQTPQGEIKLEFSSGSCDFNLSRHPQSDLGIQEIKWLDDTTLQVKACVRINCGEKIEGGDYEMIGNKIILSYKSPLCKELCMDCMCDHGLTYKFTNLEKKDYQFELRRIE